MERLLVFIVLLFILFMLFGGLDPMAVDRSSDGGERVGGQVLNVYDETAVVDGVSGSYRKVLFMPKGGLLPKVFVLSSSRYELMNTYQQMPHCFFWVVKAPSAPNPVVTVTECYRDYLPQSSIGD